MTLVAHRQTLDLDCLSKAQTRDIMIKVSSMPCCEMVCSRPSSLKGDHVIIYCKKGGCSLCRLVFDSPKRYAEDLQRPEKCRNILFSKKLMVRQL
jgi:hypothetical protein